MIRPSSRLHLRSSNGTSHPPAAQLAGRLRRDADDKRQLHQRHGDARRRPPEPTGELRRPPHPRRRRVPVPQTGALPLHPERGLLPAEARREPDPAEPRRFLRPERFPEQSGGPEGSPLRRADQEQQLVDLGAAERLQRLAVADGGHAGPGDHQHRGLLPAGQRRGLSGDRLPVALRHSGALRQRLRRQTTQASHLLPETVLPSFDRLQY